MQAKVTIGDPELQRLARGETVRIRVKPGTEELQISASLIARGQLQKAYKPKSATEELLDRIMPRGI